MYQEVHHHVQTQSCVQSDGPSQLQQVQATWSNPEPQQILHTKLIYFLARDSMLSALYAIARPSVRLFVRPSVRLSVTRVDQSKTVEVRIMQFSPYSRLIPLVFAG